VVTLLTGMNEDRNMTTTVEFEVTASHVLEHGSGRTEINESNMTTTLPKRGFQHVFKSNITTSSLRVHAAYKATV
jgi:hypothetical protein